TADGFAASNKRIWLYIGRCEKETSVDDVAKYIKDKIPQSEFIIEKLNSKGINSSFKIGDENLKDELYKSEFWPSGILVKRFRFFEDKLREMELTEVVHFEAAVLRIAHLNIQGISNKLTQLEAFHCTNKIDILCLKNYKCVSSFSRFSFIRGGACIFINYCYLDVVSELDFVRFDSIEGRVEACGIIIDSNERKTCI
ncbi:hypothetical protein HHI36_009675, partial [Cryptolaemus montrouzieri]